MALYASVSALESSFLSLGIMGDPGADDLADGAQASPLPNGRGKLEQVTNIR